MNYTSITYLILVGNPKSRTYYRECNLANTLITTIYKSDAYNFDGYYSWEDIMDEIASLECQFPDQKFTAVEYSMNTIPKDKQYVLVYLNHYFKCINKESVIESVSSIDEARVFQSISKALNTRKKLDNMVTGSFSVVPYDGKV